MYKLQQYIIFHFSAVDLTPTTAFPLHFTFRFCTIHLNFSILQTVSPLLLIHNAPSKISFFNFINTLLFFGRLNYFWGFMRRQHRYFGSNTIFLYYTQNIYSLGHLHKGRAIGSRAQKYLYILILY